MIFGPNIDYLVSLINVCLKPDQNDIHNLFRQLHYNNETSSFSVEFLKIQ